MDDSERERIKGLIRKAVSEFKDEQLSAYNEYQKERVRQTEFRLNESNKLIGDLEAELNKRREKK